MALPDDFRLDYFIKSIQNNRVLYDADHPNYNDAALKEQIWHAISEQHNVNVNHCRSLWMCLCTPYFTALRVINETDYVSRDRILNRCHLKFLDEHLKNFVHRPVNEQLIHQIILEVRREIEKDRNHNNYGLPSKIMATIRQVKLNKWSDTTAMRKTHPDRVNHIRRAINGIVIDIIQAMKPAIKRRKALKRSHKNKEAN